MADANAKTCSHIEEIEVVEKAKEVREDEVNTDETMVEKWTMLNANNEQGDNENSQSQETQENWIMVNRDAVSKNDDAVPKDKNEVSKDDDFSNNYTRKSKTKESFDGSDSISVITESSDTDSNNQISPIDDSFQINNIFHDRSRLLTLERQRNTRNSLIACALGIIMGFFLYFPFTLPDGSQISNGIDRESFKVATYNIDNIYKELPQVKAMLSEIQARISDNAKIRKKFLVRLSEIIDSSNKMSSKPIMAVIESFNSNSYPLDQLQVSLHVLSSLTFIDDNIPLKNEINKILDMVNDTKVFYETLISFNNNTQNNSVVLEFLQSGNDIIRITSEELLFDLIEKMTKVMLNVHKKYAKVGQKLSKKLCHLKNMLPNDELLKQLTENNQVFKNYDKSCFSNRNLKKSNHKRSRTKGANNVKQQIGEADDTVLNTKDDKKNIQKIYDNRKNSLKNESNETQNINNSTTADSKKIKLNMHNNYNKIRDKLYEVLSYLEDARSDPSKLEQLTKNCGEKSKKSINRCERKDNCPQSLEIQKNDLPESDFDSTLIKRQLNDICPFSELNKWPEFDKNIITPDSVPDHETESDNINPNSKHKVNSTTIALDHGNSANILTEEKNRSKQEDDFKSKDSTKKPLNNKNAYIKERDVSSQSKMKNHIPKDTFNHHESKQPTFNEHTIKQNDKPCTLEKDDVSRVDARKKQWQFDASDWYFQRVDSRKNARKNVEYQRNWYFQRADSRKNARNYAEYRRDSKRSRRRKRHPHRIVDEDGY